MNPTAALPCGLGASVGDVRGCFSLNSLFRFPLPRRRKTCDETSLGSPANKSVRTCHLQIVIRKPRSWLPTKVIQSLSAHNARP